MGNTTVHEHAVRTLLDSYVHELKQSLFCWV